MQRISTMHGRKHSFASNQPQFSKIPLKTRPNTRENTANARISNFSTLNKPSTQLTPQANTSFKDLKFDNSQQKLQKTTNYSYMNNWQKN